MLQMIKIKIKIKNQNIKGVLDLTSYPGIVKLYINQHDLEYLYVMSGISFDVYLLQSYIYKNNKFKCIQIDRYYPSENIILTLWNTN